MNFTIKEAAQLIGGKICGDENISISKVARIEEALKGELTFLYHPTYEKYYPSTKASVILVKPDFKKTRDDITYIEVESPDKAFGKIIIKYFTPDFNLNGINDLAFIHNDALIGKGISLGMNVVISAGCKIGNNVKIFHNTVLLENVEVGDDTIMYQNVSIREKCRIGERVLIHSGVVIGSDGFGFNPDEKGIYQKVPQIGNVIIEDDVELGANTTIDRAAVGSTIIGCRTKIDNLVQIGHNVVVGEDTVISAQCGISGSTKIGSNCILAGQVGVGGHLEIVDKVVILGKTGVTKSLTEEGYYYGYPVKKMRIAHRLEAHIRNLPDYSERIKKIENEIKKMKDQLLQKTTH
ncbi:MAG: UDP-3-O-(3-hydroxymyristoyl)glucosamine N-acyltransferase [Bacteroidetes bacterium]|nr:UDP-3-O-(3-hydroxymyristoyl)glucosamine N-acyltransferase [Bacteroidota bacterium]MCH8034990.1 UDP-3-O-(3-hydroxymyristoyl)glucosamine N-acyltransferase [Bacteroidota bacterium]